MSGEWLRVFRTRLRKLFRRKQEDAALRTEMEFHFDQLVAEYKRSGLSDVEATDAARKEFGAVDVYKEEARDTWRPPALSDVGRSLALACRSLARTPGFTAIAILTLGLGIGANTSMFSMLNGILLKPLPYEDSDGLIRVYRALPHDSRGGVSPADWTVAKQELREVGEVSAYAYWDVSLGLPSEPPVMVTAGRVSADFFTTLRVVPQLGRNFRLDEEAYGSHRVALLSHRIWRTKFAKDPNIVGKTVRMDGVLHEVIGVMPDTINDWRWIGEMDVFRPLAFSPEEAKQADKFWLRLVARPIPGTPPSEIAAKIAAVGHRLIEASPETNAGSSWRSAPLNGSFTDGTGPRILGLLVGLSSFVLLIACSNLANYFLARTMARSREFAVRAALGASRGQLLRPLLLEALVLAVAGGLVALVVADFTSAWLRHVSTGDNGESVVLQMDWKVFAWAMGASLATALLFAIAPARFALKLNLNASLKSGGRNPGASVSHQRLRRGLIIGQYALAMVLLAGAGLFVKGLEELNARRHGWTADRLATGIVLFSDNLYSSSDDIATHQRELIRRLEALPGVEAATLAAGMPFFGFPGPAPFVVEGEAARAVGHDPVAELNSVSPGYFSALGTPSVRGRLFTAHDDANAPRVCLINEAAAKRLFGEKDPVGRRLALVGAEAQERWEIVGVVGDTRSLVPNPKPSSFQIYFPLAQRAEHYVHLAVKMRVEDPERALPRIRECVAALNPDLPVRSLSAASVQIARANYQYGVVADLLMALGTLGLALALLGIFGLVSRTVAQRTNEFGIRLALGANASDIIGMILKGSVWLVLIGSVLGLIGSWGVSRMIQFALPEMATNSLPILGGLAVLFLTISLIACYIPARRAAKISAAEALRAD